MPIADVPSHFHGKAAKVDRSRQDLQPGVVHQPPADERGQGGAIVGHGHHLGYREEVCHGDRDVALQLLLRQRLRLLDQDEETDYVDLEKVSKEINEARRLYTKHDWPVINVSRKSIEETAATIIQMVNRRRDDLS